MIARDLFGALVIAAIYFAVFMAFFWIAMVLGEGPPGRLERIVTAVVAILSFPSISPFLYVDSLTSAIADQATLIRLAILNGLLWGFFIVWVRRKLLNRLGQTRLL
jgi:hypothetical protein